MNKASRFVQSVAALGLSLLTALQLSADDWPQWRGPNRDNRSRETGLRPSWPAEGPPLVWRLDGMGDGIASLAVSGGRIFTSTTYGNTEYAVALDESTGERLWATPIGWAAKENPLMRWLSQRTPTIDGNQAFVFTNSGWLVCLDATTGSVKWRLSYALEFGMKAGKWGFCDRPLVDSDKLLCTTGGSKATVAALDKNTGKVIWSTLLENGEGHGYGASLAIDTDGVKQFVVVLDQGIASFAANDGRFLWRYDGVSSRIANTYTPLVLADGLLCPNGYGTGIARLKLTRAGDKVRAKEQYMVRANLDPFEDSTALINDHLYAFLSREISACFDVDGKPLWRSRGSGSGKAAATYADEHLYVRWEDGAVTLVEANPQSYIEKSHFVLPDPRQSIGATFPVVAGGRLYIRDNDRLYGFDVRERQLGGEVPPPNIVQWTPPKDVRVDFHPSGERLPNAIFIPTPQDVVEKMLAAAHVEKDDVVYDLGSGDGRIVIEAARRYQCRAIGLELDPELVALSRQRAKEAKVDHLVTIKEADIFTTDFSEATVVAVYLFPELLSRLEPKLRQLAPGARIISHQFEIPNYPPERALAVESQETGTKHTIYLWTLGDEARNTRQLGTRP